MMVTTPSPRIRDHDLLELAFRTSGDCVAMLALDGTIMAVDGGCAKPGGTWVRQWRREEQAAALVALEAARQGCRGQATGSTTGEDGQERVWNNHVVPVFGAEGKPDRLLVVARDVTAQHEANAALEKKGKLHQALIEATSEIVWHFDVARKRTERAGWTAFTGEANQPSGAEDWLAALHPEDGAQTRAVIEDAVSRRTAFIVEYRLRHKSGEWRWVEDHGVPLVDASGAPTDWIGIISDTHARKTAERGLRRSEERLRLAIEATDLGTWDVDLRHRRQALVGRAQAHARPARPACVPTEADPARPRSRGRSVPPSPVTMSRRSCRHRLAERRVPDHPRRHGETRWIRSQGRAVLDAAGAPLRRIGTFQDVTDQHETRQALRLALRRYEALIAATSEIVWHASADQMSGDGRGWTEFTGQSADEANGDGWLELVHPDDRERAKRTCEEALAAGVPTPTNIGCAMSAATWRWVLDRVVPLVDDDGRLAEWVGIISDIHDRKTAEDRIWQAAHTDELTGVANRTLFQASLDKAIDHADRTGGIVGLLVIDLDRFKEVNDSLGHDAGDAVLRTVAMRARGICPARRHDRAPRRRRVRRHPAGRRCSVDRGDRRRGPGVAKQPCISAGASSIAPRLDRLRRLSGAGPCALGPVEECRHRALRGQGRRARPGPPSTLRCDASSTVGSQVLRHAKDALARDAIVPFYQPKMSLADGRIIGFEALLRWTDESGLRMPGSIQEAFGDYELAARLGARMLREGPRRHARLDAAGIPSAMSRSTAAARIPSANFADAILPRSRAQGCRPAAWRSR